ncbi:TPA: FGGY family carbohydrate kinase [Haemophilus influenzae]
MYIGIDCGTQGTKAIVLDSVQKKVIGAGYAKHELITQSNGRREQQPNWWIEALQQALQIALKQAKNSPHFSPNLVKGIGISGQQHGLVMLDKNDRPLYKAKLWCDTETATENDILIEKLGGQTAVFEKLGIICQTGYTASKLSWFRQNYPDKFANIRKIMLPHDYLNYWLTGKFCTEFGDASGSGYFDVVKREWKREVFKYLAPELNQLAQQAPIGANGITILPFFNGERVPPLPNTKASILGLDSSNFTRENLCRAMMESATFTLRYGLDLFRQAGLKTSQIRLIGGGAKSSFWRQMIADVMNSEVVCLQEEEAAALGGAIQAMWANGEGELEFLCETFIHLDENSKAYPNLSQVKNYQSAYERYLTHLSQLY